MKTKSKMDILLILSITIIIVTVLCQISEKAVYILKFAYVQFIYMFMSIFICIIAMPRPRHPQNGVIACSIMKYFNRLMSISFDFINPERLEVPSGAVLLLNHQSMIDVMVIVEMWPVLRTAAPIGKKSILYMGPFGLCLWLLGTRFIDRTSNTNKQDMNFYGDEAKAKGTKLIVFPEGTRNSKRNYELLPFKKGAFHVALDGNLPILPVVISQYNFLDNKAMKFDPGKVTVKVLPRIETTNYSKETIGDLVEYTHNIMEDALRSMRDS